VGFREGSRQAEAINKGLAKANGEIIAWLNSDDMFINHSIQAAVDNFKEHPDAVLIYGNVLSIDQDGKPINLMKYKDWGLEGLMRFRIIGQPGVYVRRSALLKTVFG